MKGVFKWNLSKGERLETILDIAKWVFIALQAITGSVRIIWYGNNEAFHSALTIIFFAFALCWLGCLAAEMVVWSQNIKLKEISQIKRQVETPKNTIKIRGKIRGKYHNDVSVSGNATLEQVAIFAGIPFDRAEFGLVGSGYVYPKDKDKQVSEIISDQIALVVIDMDDKEQDKTEI